MIVRTVALVLLGALPRIVSAAPDAAASAEIQALLAFVERSPCAFVRSGTAYDGPSARKHLERKYDYARARLSTADQFIRYVASGSSVTGEPYRVRCEGREEDSRAWLETELRRIRSGESGKAAPAKKAQ